MKRYLEISVSVPSDRQELLLPAMLEIGCTGFQQSDDKLLCYMEAGPRPGELAQAIRTLLRRISVNAPFEIRELEEKNWNAEWERTMQPIEVGSRFVIKPSWAAYEARGGRLVVQIDPKMSFGTGYHESTRLVLRLMERIVTPGMEVLDAGTGTGLLAIAAVKLGAAAAHGTDIDEWALLNARENVAANGVAGAVTISDAAVASLPAGRYHLVAANLTLETNTELASAFYRVLRPGGTLIVSGLLAGDRDAMLRALAAAGFTNPEVTQENDWIAIAAGKGP